MEDRAHIVLAAFLFRPGKESQVVFKGEREYEGAYVAVVQVQQPGILHFVHIGRTRGEAFYVTQRYLPRLPPALTSKEDVKPLVCVGKIE